MKKTYVAIFMCILMLVSIPLATAQQVTTKSIAESIIESNDGQPQSLIGVTFIAGFISKPQEVGKFVQAKAVFLGYYDRGLIVKDSGIATGLKTVRFRAGDLLFMSEPNELGLVQVIGICTGFSVSRI